MAPSSNSSDTALKWHWEILSRSDWTESRVKIVNDGGRLASHEIKNSTICIGMGT